MHLTTMLLQKRHFHNPQVKKLNFSNGLNKIIFDNWLLKPALYDLCCKNAPPPEYSIDKLAAEYGCKIVRTPQYHPELQPIEHVWGIVKSNIAETQAGDYTMKSLKERLVASLEKITTEICKKIFLHVRKEEERYWKVDEKLDEMKIG